jgi:hypothetical protein
MGAGATMGSCMRHLPFHAGGGRGPKSITWTPAMAKHNSGVRACFDPFEVKKVMKYIPRHITRRLTAQAGLFTIHPEPDKPYENPNMIDRLIIKKASRRLTVRANENWFLRIT